MIAAFTECPEFGSKAIFKHLNADAWKKKIDYDMGTFICAESLDDYLTCADSKNIKIFS